MDKEADKRQRATNFSETEAELPISLVNKYRTIIENKRSDAVSRKEKEKAWVKMAMEYAALTQIRRSATELKNKYENIKRQLKRKISDNKIEILKTGGGTADCKKLSESEECLQSMLSISIDGLPSNGDSDALPTENIINPRPSSSTYIPCDEMETIKIIVEGSEQCNPQPTWQDWSPKLLQTKKSAKLMTPQIPQKTRKEIKSTGETNIKFSELAEAKLELVSLQKQYLQNEEKRKEEFDHVKLQKLKLEMELLKKKEELDIEYKEMQILLLQKQLQK